MTFTEMYREVDLKQLNTMLAAQGKNYEFFRDGEEIKFRIRKERETDGISVTKRR